MMLRSAVFQIMVFITLGLAIECQAQNAICSSYLLEPGGIQAQIWKLRQQGATAQARNLEEEVVRILTHDKARRDGSPEDGSTEVHYMRFDSGLRAVFKPINAGENSISGKNEVAAYRLSKLFELDLVPVTVLRKFGRHMGSLQVYLPALKNGFQSRGEIHPNAWFFDFLVNYSDSVHSRFIDKKDNFLALSNRRQALIDNAETFFAEFEEDPNLDTLKIWNATVIVPIRKLGLRLNAIKLSRPIWERVSQVTDDEIRRVVIDLLPQPLVDRIILRRRLYLARMD